MRYSELVAPAVVKLSTKILSPILVAAWLLVIFRPAAQAVPSYSRQTGLPRASVQRNVEYHFGTKLSGTVGLFSVNGTPDPILFPQAAVFGSANGDPRSNGYILNLSWWPYQNIDLAVQYTGYNRFNGLQTNYDGASRDASSNKTV